MPAPIGLFDSGLGGFTVIKAIKEILPHEDILYIADTAHVPYGVKSRSHIQRLSYRLTGFLLGQGVRVVVVACNSAIGSMLPEAREDFSSTILGPILPAALKAMEVSRKKRIGILATTATIQGGYYQRALQSLDVGVRLYCREAPDLVSLVEEGQFDGERVTKVVRGYVAPFLGQIDTLILGCTHFPLLIEAMKEELSEDITIIDPAIYLAEEVANTLKKLDQPQKGEGSYRFLSTDREGLSPISIGWLKSYLEITSLEFSPLTL